MLLWIPDYISAWPDDLHNFYMVRWLHRAWELGLDKKTLPVFGGYGPNYYLTEQFEGIASLSWLLLKAGLTLSCALQTLYLIFIFLNGACAYLFAREFALSRPLALISAFAFAHGFGTRSLINSSLIRAPVFVIPLMLWCYLRLAKHRRVNDVVLFGVLFFLFAYFPLSFLLFTCAGLTACWLAYPLPFKAAIWTGLSLLPGVIRILVLLGHYSAAHKELAPILTSYANIFSTPHIEAYLFRTYEDFLAFYARTGLEMPVEFHALLPSHLLTVIFLTGLASTVYRCVRDREELPHQIRGPINLWTIVAVGILVPAAGFIWLYLHPAEMNRYPQFLTRLARESIFTYLLTGFAVIALSRVVIFRRLGSCYGAAAPEMRSLILLCILGIVFPLGIYFGRREDTVLFAPYFGLQILLPIFGSIRAIGRWSIFASLTIPILAICSVESTLGVRSRLRLAVYSALCITLFLEMQPAWEQLKIFQWDRRRIYYVFGRDDAPEYYQRTRGNPWEPQIYRHFPSLDKAMTMELPTELDWNVGNGAGAIYFSMHHWFPIVNGHSSYYPSGHNDLLRELTVPIQGMVSRMSAVGVRYIVVHSHRYLMEDRKSLEAELGSYRIAREIEDEGLIDDWLIDLGKLPAALGETERLANSSEAFSARTVLIGGGLFAGGPLGETENHSVLGFSLLNVTGLPLPAASKLIVGVSPADEYVWLRNVCQIIEPRDIDQTPLEDVRRQIVLKAASWSRTPVLFRGAPVVPPTDQPSYLMPVQAEVRAFDQDKLEIADCVRTLAVRYLSHLKNITGNRVLGLLLVPSRLEADDLYWKSVEKLGSKVRVSGRDRFGELFAGIATELEIPLIDTRVVMRENLLAGFELYEGPDNILSVKGRELVAQALLNAEGLSQKR